MFLVKARYYSNPDQLIESFVLVSDNKEKDLRLEVGTKVRIVPLCSCGKDATEKGLCNRCFIEAYEYR